MTRRMQTTLTLAGLLFAVTLAGGWMLWNAGLRGAPPARAPASAIVTLPEPKRLADFTLYDSAGELFDLEDLRHRWSFVFFGFTWCPDVCPTTLVTLARLREAILARGIDPRELAIVFVSVDPQRDSPELLGNYVRHFDPQFLGVTGSAAQLSNLSRQLGAAYRVEYQEGASDYPVYHSASVFVIDPLARLHAVASPPFDPEAMARSFEALRKPFATR